MIKSMPAEENPTNSYRRQAVVHLEKLAAQLQEEETELSRPNEIIEDRRLAEGRRAAAAALEAARRLSSALGES
jgi:hypothetical protein